MMIITLDSFFDDPMKMRKLAQTFDYHDEKKRPCFIATEKYLAKEIREKVFPIIKAIDKAEGVTPPRYKPDAFFQYFIDSKDKRKGHIHTDRGSRWSAIAYLSLNPKSFPGTNFYSHKETKLDKIPDQVEKNKLDLVARALIDNGNFRKWNLISTVEGRFNRLVLFRSDMLHVNASRWGTNLQNGRLTYNCFL